MGGGWREDGGRVEGGRREDGGRGEGVWREDGGRERGERERGEGERRGWREGKLHMWAWRIVSRHGRVILAAVGRVLTSPPEPG